MLCYWMQCGYVMPRIGHCIAISDFSAEYIYTSAGPLAGFSAVDFTSAANPTEYHGVCNSGFYDVERATAA